MTEKSEFRHESLEDAHSIASYLRALQDGLASRSLRFSDEDGAIVLQPQGLMGFEVRAHRRRGREKLTINLSWRSAEPSEDHGPLKINGDRDAAGDAQP